MSICREFALRSLYLFVVVIPDITHCIIVSLRSIQRLSLLTFLVPRQSYTATWTASSLHHLLQVAPMLAVRIILSPVPAIVLNLYLTIMTRTSFFGRLCQSLFHAAAFSTIRLLPWFLSDEKASGFLSQLCLMVSVGCNLKVSRSQLSSSAFADLAFDRPLPKSRSVFTHA